MKSTTALHTRRSLSRKQGILPLLHQNGFKNRLGLKYHSPNSNNTNKSLFKGRRNRQCLQKHTSISAGTNMPRERKIPTIFLAM